jgi:hypothetical protein
MPHATAASFLSIATPNHNPSPYHQALEIARKRYYAEARAEKRKVKRFDVSRLSAELEKIGADKNLVGWTLIPRNMMRQPNGEGGREVFHPADALDCAGMRGRGQGVLVARATFDANNHVHPVSISHMLAPEGDLSVGAHISAERHLLGDGVMNKFGHLTFVDGHASLEGEIGKQLPNVHILRCHTHMKDMLMKRGGRARHAATLDALDKFKNLPKGRNGVAVANAIYDALPANSPLRQIKYASLHLHSGPSLSPT